MNATDNSSGQDGRKSAESRTEGGPVDPATSPSALPPPWEQRIIGRAVLKRARKLAQSARINTER